MAISPDELNRTGFVIMSKIKGFTEKVVCLIFMFADQLLLVDVFS